MDREAIKQELSIRAKRLAETKYKSKTSDGALTQMTGRLKNTEPFMNDVVKILNDILRENKIEMNGKTKDDFIEYIQPEMIKIMQDQILNR